MLSGDTQRLECLPPPPDLKDVLEPEEWSAGCRVVLLWQDGQWVRQPILTHNEREQLIERCKANCLDLMFGDNSEEEYVMTGFPEWKGLLNMTDAELLEEYGHYGEEDRTSEQRGLAFRRELEEDR